MKASEILKTSPFAADRIFYGSSRDIKRQFRQLASIWHPDVSDDPQANKVFAHLMILKNAALSGAGDRSAVDPRRVLVTTDGRRIAVNVLRSHAFDGGEVIIGPSSINYLYRPDAAPLAEQEALRVSSLPYKDDWMRNEMVHSVPELKQVMRLDDGSVLISYARKPDEVFLPDLLGHLRSSGRSVEPEHAAWMMSRLLSICCYLQVSGQVHGAVMSEHILVNPEKHSLRLVGGWGYACREGERPKRLPARTLRLVPILAVKGQTVSAAVDQACARGLISELLGHPPAVPPADSALPANIAMWLNLKPEGDAIELFTEWRSELMKAWGPPRFIDMDVRAAEVYEV